MGMDGWREIGKHSFTPLSLEETLLGGQSFVWTKKGSHQWRGAIGRSIVDLSLRNGRLSWRASLLHPFSEGELTKYLWIDGSYDAAIEEMPWRSDPVLRESLRAFSGLRILGQPFDETLFYFLLSSAKSISQIKSCGEAVALRYGEKLGFGIGSFPGWNRLCEVPEEELRKLKLGYRAKYVAGVANFLASRSGWLEETASLPYEKAKTTVLAGFLGIDEERRQGHLLGVVVHFLGPFDVWPAISYQKADGTFDLGFSEILFHLNGHTRPFGIVQVHSFEVPVAVGNLSERDNVETHLFEDGHQKLGPRLDLAMVRVGPVTGRHQAGKQGKAAWATTW